MPEHLIDAVVAVSGSSPAYIFMMIEAMADGAVAEGMPRSQAYQFAAQAVLGSAKMVTRDRKASGRTKDMDVHRQEQRLRQYVYLRNLD